MGSRSTQRSFILSARVPLNAMGLKSRHRRYSSSSASIASFSRRCHSMPDLADRKRPYRSGWLRGLTYKAILQTLHFMSLLFDEPLDNNLMRACASLAPELLRKHPEPDEHLRTVEAIAHARGLPMGP